MNNIYVSQMVYPVAIVLMLWQQKYIVSMIIYLICDMIFNLKHGNKNININCCLFKLINYRLVHLQCHAHFLLAWGGGFSNVPV